MFTAESPLITPGSYAKVSSLWLDIRIIAMTIGKILKREGISHPGQATMEEFTGVGAKYHPR